MGRKTQTDDGSRSADQARRGVGRRWARHRLHQTGLAIAASCFLAACHGSSATSAASTQATNADTQRPAQSTSDKPPLQTGTASPTGSNPASNANSSSSTTDAAAFIDLGKLTVSTVGSSVSTAVKVAPPTPNTVAQPPAEVLSACQWDYPPTLAQAVFIHGSLTITYTGKLPESVSLVDPFLLDLKTGFQLNAGFAIQTTDGSWDNCGQGFGTTMQPGQSVTVEMWINDPELSNTHPTFSLSDTNGLALQGAAGDTDEAGLGYGNTTTATGPRAANCSVSGQDPKPTLLLYSTAPAQYGSGGSSPTSSCTATQ